MASSQSLFADFLSPFAESKVGTTHSSEGQIVAAERKDGGIDYFINVKRCGASSLNIPANIPDKLITSKMIDQFATITATIREKEDAEKKTMIRYLEVTEIEISK
jgi:hypothetical protein